MSYIRKWTDAEREQPASGEWYLVYLSPKNYNVQYEIAYLDTRGHWKVSGEYIDADVTHWASLPPPPGEYKEPCCCNKPEIFITFNVNESLDPEALCKLVQQTISEGIRGY